MMMNCTPGSVSARYHHEKAKMSGGVLLQQHFSIWHLRITVFSTFGALKLQSSIPVPITQPYCGTIHFPIPISESYCWRFPIPIFESYCCLAQSHFPMPIFNSYWLARTNLFMHVWMYVCMYVCMCARIYVTMQLSAYLVSLGIYVATYASRHVRMYACT